MSLIINFLLSFFSNLAYTTLSIIVLFWVNKLLSKKFNEIIKDTLLDIKIANIEEYENSIVILNSINFNEIEVRVESYHKNAKKDKFYYDNNEYYIRFFVNSDIVVLDHFIILKIVLKIWLLKKLLKSTKTELMFINLGKRITTMISEKVNKKMNEKING